MDEGTEIDQGGSHTSNRPNHTAASTRLARLPSLSSEERWALGNTILHSRSLRAGAELVRQYEAIGSLNFLVDGWACKYKLARNGRRQISALLAPNEICNLDALFFDRLDYGVRMLTAGTVVSLPRKCGVALVADYPGIALGVARLGFVENTILAEWTLRLGRQSARERVAHFLCEMAARLGCDEDGEVSFELPLTQEHIADILGLTPVHVSRTLGTLRNDGLLMSTFGTITISDVATLRRIANFSSRYLHIDGK